MGINGAFLTGDLFSLFVFFEVLLISSYGLLLHGGGHRRIGAALHYVILNLTASALFLVTLGMVYSSTGTLNMAALALSAGDISGPAVTLLAAGSALLVVVFAEKAALVPLHPWLPRAYGSAVAPPRSGVRMVPVFGPLRRWRSL